MKVYKYSYGTCTTPPWTEQLKEKYIGFVDVDNYDYKNEYEWITGIEALNCVDGMNGVPKKEAEWDTR